MFKEAEIRTFIEGTTNYFETSAQQSATVGSPQAIHRSTAQRRVGRAAVGGL